MKKTQKKRRGSTSPFDFYVLSDEKYRQCDRKLCDIISRQVDNSKATTVCAAEIYEAEHRIGYEEERCADKEEQGLRRVVQKVAEYRLKKYHRQEEVIKATYGFQFAYFLKSLCVERNKRRSDHDECAEEWVYRERRYRIHCGKVRKVPECEKRHADNEKNAVVRTVEVFELHENISAQSEDKPENAKYCVERVLVGDIHRDKPRRNEAQARQRFENETAHQRLVDTADYEYCRKYAGNCGENITQIHDISLSVKIAANSLPTVHTYNYIAKRDNVNTQTQKISRFRQNFDGFSVIA